MDLNQKASPSVVVMRPILGPLFYICFTLFKSMVQEQSVFIYISFLK